MKRTVFFTLLLANMIGCTTMQNGLTARQGVHIGQTCQPGSGLIRHDNISNFYYSPKNLTGYGESDLKIGFVENGNFLIFENIRRKCFTEIEFESEILSISYPASQFVNGASNPLRERLNESLDKLWFECEKMIENPANRSLEKMSLYEERSACATPVAKSQAFVEVETNSGFFTIFNSHFGTFVW